MSYLLDTNVVSEIRKRDPDPLVRRWIASRPGLLYISVLVIGEIRQGIARLQPRDPEQASAIESWLGLLRHEYRDRILPITPDVSDEWGRLNARCPLPVIDGLMAATAIVHGLTLVTRNVADVSRTGAPILNPFVDG